MIPLNAIYHAKKLIWCNLLIAYEKNDGQAYLSISRMILNQRSATNIRKISLSVIFFNFKTICTNSLSIMLWQFTYGARLAMNDSSAQKYFHLAYLSHPSDDLTKQSLLDLLTKAQQYNIQHGISGILIVRDKSLFQLLEGDETEVRNLYKKIEHDPRHLHPTVIYEGVSSMRSIPFLGMGLTLDQSDDHLADEHGFYFDRAQALKFTALVSGKIKQLLLQYLDH